MSEDAAASMRLLLEAAGAASHLLILLGTLGAMLFVAGSGSRRHVINTIFRFALGAGAATFAYLLIGRDMLAGEGPVFAAFAAIGGVRADAGAAVAAPGLVDATGGLAALLLAHGLAAGVAAGRATLLSATLFAALFAALLYPLALYTLAAPAGLLAGAAPTLFSGFAIHLVAGATALAGALALGPRLGFNGYDPVNLGPERLLRVTASHAPHHAPMAAQGAALIWLAFLGVALSAALAEAAPLQDPSALAAYARIRDAISDALTPLALAPVAGMTIVAAIYGVLRRDLELFDLLSAALAALAAAASLQGPVGPLEAAFLGLIGAAASQAARAALASIGVDDPTAAAATHGVGALMGAGGAVALALAGFGALSDPAASASVAAPLAAAAGLFAAVFVAAFIAYRLIEILCKLIAILTRRATLREALRGNRLRIDFEAEIFGLDETQHGQDAYTFRPLR